jgi:hypothetical protein
LDDEFTKEESTMISYNELSEHPRKFLAMTGYTVEEFQALLPHFRVQFEKYVEPHTLDGKPRTQRQYSTYETSPLPTIEGKLLFILIYLKQGTTEAFNAEDEQALYFFHDGTERPIPRPKDKDAQKKVLQWQEKATYNQEHRGHQSPGQDSLPNPNL